MYLSDFMYYVRATDLKTIQENYCLSLNREIKVVLNDQTFIYFFALMQASTQLQRWTSVPPNFYKDIPGVINS